MVRCKQCGKGGLFLKLTPNDICPKCDTLNKEMLQRQKEAEQKKIIEAQAEKERLKKIKEEVKSKNLYAELKAYRSMYYYNNVDIAGSENCDYSNTQMRNILYLKAEPSNEFDNKAIAVYCDDVKIGYVHKGKFQDMIHDFWKHDDYVYARLTSNAPNNAKMSLSFHIKRLPFEYYEKNQNNAQSYKLISNKSEEIQGNISVSEKGDECYISYDPEKGKYGVSPVDKGYEIGFLPAKFNEEYDEDEAERAERLIPYISELKQISDEKTDVLVKVFRAITVSSDKLKEI